jgi:tetratricopeptide (TPR) repeat protein
MLFAEVDASPGGRIAGQIFVVLLLLAGILKCISISRRPTTNSKGVWSLALFLAVFLVPATINFIPKETPAYRALIILGGLFLIGLFVASIILAIIGLMECARERERFIQGRAQAIWALVLSGIFLLFAVSGAATGFTRALKLKNQPTNHELLTFAELNFKFSSPGRPWMQADAAKLNRSAKLAFIRAYPEMYFVVIAESLGNLDYTTESLADMAHIRLQSVAESLRVLEQKPVLIGGLNGLEVHTEAQVQNHSIFYVQWFCVTNGWSYQLTTWGTSSEQKMVVQDAQQMMGGFALIDYQRRPAIVGGEAMQDYVSTNFGYRVRCADSDWIKWKNLETACPFASFGALHRENAALAVSAISLTDLKTEPEAIYRGFFGLSTTTDVLKDAHKIQEQNLEGVETTFSQTIASGKEYTYRLKVLQSGGFAYFVAAWVESRNPQKDKILDDAMSRVEFLGVPQVPPNISTLSTQEKRAQRMALNGIGMIYFNEQRFEQSADFFKKAVELDGLQKNTAYLANLTTARIRTGNFRSALDELEQHPQFVDSQPALAANRAFLQGRLGQTDLALTNYAKLFAAGYNSEDHFKEYVGLLAQTQQQKRALDEVESYLKKEDSPDIRLVQAALLKQLKKFDEAIALLQAQRKKNPFNAGIAYSLGDTFIQAGKPSEALALSDEMLKQDGSSAAIWLLKGRAQFALKWYREAKESFNNVIAEAPSNTDARQFLQILSGILGEGSNAALQDSIAAVTIPNELTNSIPEPAEKFGRDEGAYYSRRLTAVSFQKGEKLKTTEYLKAHISSPAGVSAFSTFQLVFNPLNEEMFVNQLLVKNSAGALVSTGRVADYYILDDRSSSAASSRKVLNIPVAGLQPGYNIELTVTRCELGKPDEFTFLPCNFSGTFPMQEQDLYFVGDTNLIRFASSPKLEPKVLPHGLLWSKTEPSVIRWESLQPPIVDYVPTVWLSDASARWPDLVTNYLATIRDRLELPEDQKQLAQQLAAGATNLTQKIAAIADYVQTNYTYKAIEFGRRARMPQPLADLVRHKYGDCKDHSVLVQQMLKAAGIPAYLALLNLISPIRKDLPSLDQFNHMVVYIPSSSENMFLDCTAKTFDLSSESFGLAGREALILDAVKPYFQKIPAYPTNASIIVLTRTIEITNQTDALVTETLKFNGIHAGWFREYFRSLPADSRRAYVVNQFVGVLGELRDFKIEGMDDPHSPLIIKFTYLARKQFQIFGNEIVGSPPLNFERSFLLDQIVEKRTTPFEISIPLTIEGSITIQVPASFKSKPADAAQNIQNQFVACRFSAVTNDAGWRLDYHIYEPANRFAPEQYPAHNLAMQQAVNALGLNLVCVRQEN